MSDIAIRAENIGKRYRIGHTVGYKTLRDSLTVAAKAPLRWLRSSSHQPSAISHQPNTIWALKDVSFEVKQGEAVGIVGRNGSGKSTLLKILSRITAPTEGTAEIHGRVASLLEVGTGFHPELTGRENIYLNGAILGMKRAEIARKFDEIVAFSEIEKFLDTPVKRYSSGMYVRLAFAVAAHMEPEILIVDEVLAVGDAAFQKKCLGKMGDVANKGRTVLFVSHNMTAVTRLCPYAILLDQGKVAREGPSYQVVSKYLESGIGLTSTREWTELGTAPGNDIVRLRSVRIITEECRLNDSFDIRHPIGIEIQYEVLKPGHILVPNYHFFNDEGVNIFIAHDWDPVWRKSTRPVGRYASMAWIPGNFLSEGTIIVGVVISTYDPVIVHFSEMDAVTFHVIDSLDGDSARGDYAGHMPGIIRPLLHCTTRFIPEDKKTRLSLGGIN